MTARQLTSDRDFFKILDYDQRVKFFEEQKTSNLQKLRQQAEKENQSKPTINKKTKQKFLTIDNEYQIEQQSIN